MENDCRWLSAQPLALPSLKRNPRQHCPPPHQFTIQRFDAATRLYLYNACVYDPVFGRFIQPDKAIPEPPNPQAFTRESDPLNNPRAHPL